MPSRKSKQFVRVLRGEILSGERAPGAKLPTYDGLTVRFGVTRPTIARGIKAMISEGLITTDGRRGIFVASPLPHHHRYLWVTSEQPGTAGWSSLSASIVQLIDQGQTGIPGEVVALLGVDGRMNNPSYQKLCDAIDRSSAAGLLLMGSATMSCLPILQAPGLPRVAIGVAAPHAALLALDIGRVMEHASSRLTGVGQRISIFSPYAPDLERAQESLLKRGIDKKQLSTLHVAPVGCEKLVELLFQRPDRPDVVFVTDDSLVPPLVAGLEHAGMRIGHDVYVLAYCNSPLPPGCPEGVDYIGFDVHEVLALAKEIIDAQRHGTQAPVRAIRPRFANELLPAPEPELVPKTSMARWP